MKNVVGLKEYRAARSYSQFNINLALDTVYRPAKRDIAKEMTKSYLKLLSK